MVNFPQQGACLCGEVRYSLSEDALTLYACHCTDCQRKTGSSFALSMLVRREALAVSEGTPLEYSLTLSDGRQSQGLSCGTCSTRLWSEPVKFPGIALLRPGTLDDTSWLDPVGHIWMRSAQPWVQLGTKTLQISGQPEAGDIAKLIAAWAERPRSRRN